MNPFMMMNPQAQSVLSRFQQFRQNFQGDPKQRIQQMLNSGQITQEQYNQAVQIIKAAMETKCGNIEIMCGDNGCAAIWKPNGTLKWYYEKTPAQVKGIIERIKSAYK